MNAEVVEQVEHGWAIACYSIQKPWITEWLQCLPAPGTGGWQAHAGDSTCNGILPRGFEKLMSASPAAKAAQMDMHIVRLFMMTKGSAVCASKKLACVFLKLRDSGSPNIVAYTCNIRTNEQNWGHTGVLKPTHTTITLILEARNRGGKTEHDIAWTDQGPWLKYIYGECGTWEFSTVGPMSTVHAGLKTTQLTHWGPRKSRLFQSYLVQVPPHEFWVDIISTILNLSVPYNPAVSSCFTWNQLRTFHQALHRSASVTWSSAGPADGVCDSKERSFSCGTRRFKLVIWHGTASKP